MTVTGAPATAPATRTADQPPPALSLRGLRRRFGATVALDGLSLDVGDGEIVALVGPSGCGKSTLLRLVAGLLEADDGEVLVRGEVVTGQQVFVPPERRPVGIVFQDHALFPHLTVAGNVAFGLRGREASTARRRVTEVLDLVELDAHGDRYPHELSGGERQRAALARALARNPAVVLLDEPLSSLDHNLRVQIRGELVEILRRAGASVLFVTHDQREALAVGDRVAVLRAGRLEQAATPEQVFHAPANRFVATFMGEADFLPAWPGPDGLLHTEVGAVEAPRAGLGGEAVEVMVRPHEVRLAAEPGGSARLTRVEFQGGFVLCEAVLPSGRRVRALRPHTRPLQVGSRVRVRLAHGHAPAVLPADPQGA